MTYKMVHSDFFLNLFCISVQAMLMSGGHPRYDDIAFSFKVLNNVCEYSALPMCILDSNIY